MSSAFEGFWAWIWAGLELGSLGAWGSWVTEGR